MLLNSSLFKCLIIVILIISACKRDQENYKSINYAKHNFTSPGIAIETDTAIPPAISYMKSIEVIKTEALDTLFHQYDYVQLKGLKIERTSNPEKIQVGSTSYPMPLKEKIIIERKLVGLPEINEAKVSGNLTRKDLNLTYYNLHSGLKTNGTLDLVRDKAGNFWGGTATNGLFKFDGKNFQFFGPKQGFPFMVRKIQIDDDGIVWMAGFSELASYDGKYITFYKIPNQEKEIDAIISFYKDKNKICWLTKGQYLMRMDIQKETIQIFNQDHGIPKLQHGFEIDNNGYLWIGSHKGFYIVDISGYSDNGFTTWHYGKEHGFDPDPLKSRAAYNIRKDKENHIWLTGFYGCTKIYSPDKNYSELRYMHIGKKNNFPSWDVPGRRDISRVHDIFQEKENHYQLSFVDKEMIQLELNGTEGRYLAYGSATTSFNFDDEKYIYGIHTVLGLLRISKNPFRARMHHPIGRTGFIRATEDQWGRIWFGTYGAGVFRYLPPKRKGDPVGYIRYNENSGLSSPYVDGFHADKKGNLWVGTRVHGLIKMELDSTTSEVTINNYRSKNGLPADVVPDIVEDKNGDIWFSTFEFGPQDTASICRVRGNELLKIGKAQGLTPRGDSWALTIGKDGDFWAALYGKQSLMNFKAPNTGEKLEAKEFTQNEHLTGVVIRDMLTDRNGDIWVAPEGGDGLIQIKKTTTDSLYQIQHFTVDHGLASNNVNGLIEDFNGDIWIGTSSGISKMISRNDSEKVTRKFINYTAADGLSGGLHRGPGSLFQASDSTIYGATGNYSFSFKPKDLLRDYPKPIVQLNRILLFDELIPWHIDGPFLLENEVKIRNYSFDSLSYWNNLPENLSLRYDNNFISFDFTGVDTNEPDRIEYAYFLEGIDDHWTETKENRVAFNRLGSGNYTFKVKAKHEQGDYGEPLSYSFRIRPPWYRSTLAYLFYALLFIGLVYFFIKERIQKVVEKIKLLEDIRSKISADLHDDVGSILTGIAMQAEYLSVKKPDDIEQEMEQLSERSREAMDKMRDIVWAMDARKDKMINLVDKMQYFATLSFENSHFKFDLQNKLDNEQSFIHPLVRQQIYLIFKEAITNILKHSNGNKVEIKFKEEAENLLLLIQDNGTSMEKKKTEGAGLENMRARVKQIKGELKIEMNNGFLIKVICPKNLDSLGYS